jgi:hypothetical protein
MGQFLFVCAVNGTGIAVNTVQVAGLGDIPNHYRFFVLGKLEQMRREFAGMPPVAKGVRWFYSTAVEFRYAYHDKSA